VHRHVCGPELRLVKDLSKDVRKEIESQRKKKGKDNAGRK
jgi:hypothetical protein